MTRSCSTTRERNAGVGSERTAYDAVMSKRRWRFIDELNRQDPNAFRYSRMGGRRRIAKRVRINRPETAKASSWTDAAVTDECLELTHQKVSKVKGESPRAKPEG
jgi:hypothetical protein